MRITGFLGLAVWLAGFAMPGCGASTQRGFDVEGVRRQVLEADDGLGRCYARGDLAGAASFLSDQYVYNDIGANRVTRDQLLARRNEDHRRVIEDIQIDSEVVVLSESVALIRGRTDTVAEYYGGLPRRGGARYISVWQREADGMWRVVAEQSTEATERTFPIKMRIEAADEQLARFAGAYTLDTSPAIQFTLRVMDRALVASIPGQFDDMVFFPESELKFFSASRPFELEFNSTAKSLTLTTWGTPVAGKRIIEP